MDSAASAPLQSIVLARHVPLLGLYVVIATLATTFTLYFALGHNAGPRPGCTAASTDVWCTNSTRTLPMISDTLWRPPEGFIGRWGLITGANTMPPAMWMLAKLNAKAASGLPDGGHTGNALVDFLWSDRLDLAIGVLSTVFCQTVNTVNEHEEIALGFNYHSSAARAYFLLFSLYMLKLALRGRFLIRETRKHGVAGVGALTGRDAASEDRRVREKFGCFLSVCVAIGVTTTLPQPWRVPGQEYKMALCEYAIELTALVFSFSAANDLGNLGLDEALRLDPEWTWGGLCGKGQGTALRENFVVAPAAGDPETPAPQ